MLLRKNNINDVAYQLTSLHMETYRHYYTHHFTAVKLQHLTTAFES